jgi:hypothetical protein
LPNMLEQEDLHNIKDLLESSIAASEKRLERKFNEKFGIIDKKFLEVERKIDDLTIAVGDAMSTSNQDFDAKLNNHEKRIKKLELKAA